MVSNIITPEGENLPYKNQQELKMVHRQLPWGSSPKQGPEEW